MSSEQENKAKTNHAQHKPLVSIGMPVYNGAKFIREALDSLLAQTFTDFELIISDNASTDETEAICREYAAKDKRIRYIRQPENRGATANFRFVLNEAVGEYFMWAAADDVWGMEFVDKCVEALNNNKLAAMAMMAYIAQSRVFKKLFEMSFDHPLSCISINDRIERVRRFSILPFTTHKDNLIYAMWRKEALLNILCGLDSIGKHKLIGAAMNEYALSLYQGVYIREIGFYKRYRFVPPGHRFSSLFSFFFKIKNLIFKKHKATSTHYTKEDHLRDLKDILNATGFDDDIVDELIRKNETFCKG